MPWKWIVCGWDPALTNFTRSVSPSVARITGPGHGAVVRPGGEEHTGRDLDLPVHGRQRVGAHPARLVRERVRRVEQRVEVVRPADGGHSHADHRGVPDAPDDRRRDATPACGVASGRDPHACAAPSSSSLAATGAAANGAAAASRRFRVNFAMSKNEV